MILGLGALATLSIGGLFAAIFYPQISGKSKVNKRVASVSGGVRQKRNGRNSALDAAQQRRKQVQDSLKEFEENQKAKKKLIRLHTRISMAGLSISVRGFYIFSVVFGLITGVVVLIMTANPLAGLGAVFVAALGLPRWVLGFLTRRRQASFINEFANAIDVIVRGIKAGLPVNDCLKVIAAESPDPVGPEFNELVEGQKLGIPLDQGLERMYEHMPLPEVNFLAIVIAIQTQTGGNLAEALANLAVVLRDRKKMHAKIRSMSQEAKSSAAIIGSLPIIVMGLVYMSTPDYIMTLFTEPMGHIMLGISAFWMICGILVMRKMINFDF
jgi:tight adherence protein B